MLMDGVLKKSDVAIRIPVDQLCLLRVLINSRATTKKRVVGGSERFVQAFRDNVRLVGDAHNKDSE